MYEVGTLNFSFVDKTRKEVLGCKESFRKIAVKLYYPVDNIIGLNKARYLSERKEKAIKKVFFFTNILARPIDFNCYDNAEMIRDKRFPLLLFSHGHFSYLEANSLLCRDVAARGYIVASIGHAYEAVENDYEDGSCDYFYKKVKFYEKGMLRTLIAQRKLMKKTFNPKECDKLFFDFQSKYLPFFKNRVKVWAEDVLVALSEIKKRYAGYLDLERGVAAGGHSYGGATAYYLCQNSDDITCGINIDGALFGDYRDKIMTKPFLQFSCRENLSAQYASYLKKEAPLYVAIFDNMKHLGFTDLKFMSKSKFLMGKMPTDVMYNYLLDCHLFFLDKYMKKVDGKMPISEHEDVEILSL